MNLFFQRLGGAIIVIFAVSTLVFLLIHLIPGDPVDVILGEMAQTGDREVMRVRLGLDQSLWVQYVHYLQNLLQLDLGQSIHSSRPVSQILFERFPATLLLTLAAFFVAVIMALPMGIIAAMRKEQVADHLAMGFSLIGLSIPNFLLGPLLILVFSLGLGWLPVSGNTLPQSIVLPAITLGLSMAAILSRMIRSSLLETLQQDYIRTARAKGVSGKRLVWHHAMANAWLPVITVLGAQLGVLLGGAVVTETVFDWPGIGSLMIESIQKRDYPVVQGCILLISVCFVLVNAFTDLFYTWVDPRIRYSTCD